MDDAFAEVKHLCKSLCFRPGSTVILYAPGAALFLALLSQAFPDSRFFALTHDIRDAEQIREAAAARGCCNLAVRAGNALATLGVDQPDVVVLRPTGREGNDTLRSLLAQALAILPGGGHLLLVTYTRRGAPSQLRMAQDRFGSAQIIERSGGGLRVIRATKSAAAVQGAAAGSEVPASGAAGGSEVAAQVAASSAGGVANGDAVEAHLFGRRFTFHTAAGVFSHRRLDEGTRLLLVALDNLPIGATKRILDLGCGYGPIGIVLAALHPLATVTMVDVDTRATTLAHANAVRNEVAGRVRTIAADGLRGLPAGGFDAVVSHLPLHIPKPEQVRLLEEARAVLDDGGALYLVALKEYGVRAAVQSLFGNVEDLCSGSADTGSRYEILRSRK